MQMKTLSLLLFLLGSLLFAQGPSANSNGYGDTSLIVGFKSTGTGYSKALNLSAWENCRIDIFAMDTANSKTGFNGGAIKFYWWTETGHYCVDYLGKLDTVWDNIDPLVIDTFDMTTAGNMVKTPRFLSVADGSYPSPHLTIDTTSVRGYAVQSRTFSPEWDEIWRVGVKGLSGNQATTYVKLIVGMHRRAAVGTRGK
jgi:hypothetical protein